MTSSRIGIRKALFASLLALAACKVNESGNIPCNDDSNCPTDYPQCIGAHGGGAGKCTEAVSGTPGLASGAIGVAPAAITGGDSTGIALSLPALTGSADLARKVTLGIDSGGSAEPVAKKDGSAVTLADLGTTITVNAPATAAADSKTYTYTLTVSNEPSSTASATAKGTLAVIPAPVLVSSTLAVSPPSITGGQAPTLTVALPSLASAAASVSAVAFAISGCGSAAAVNKHGGAAVAVADLGTTISIDSPASIASDNKTCTYTLTVSNSATTPAVATATGTLAIQPLPVISSSIVTIAPAAITGGLTPTISATLPSLASPATPSTTVKFEISGTGCGSGAVNKTGGAAVAVADLGTTITFAPPGSVAADNKVCTYTLTVSNSLTTATATGTLAIVPKPLLASASLTVAPAVITGATFPALSVTLPALTTAAASAATVVLSSDCGGAVTKVGGAALAAADLGTTVSIPAPTTAAIDDKTCNYTLTVGNAATTPSTATATGTLGVKPQPVLAAATFTLSVGTFTGSDPLAIGTFTTTLPALTSPAATGNAVDFTIDDGTGPVQQKKSNNNSVALADLGNSITVNLPTTTITDNKTFTYTLTLRNSATTPATAVATGTLHVVPKPTLSATGAGAFTVAPAAITGGTANGMSTTLPSLTSPAASAATVGFAISGGASCGTLGAVNKTGGAPVAASDLGLGIAFDGPTTADAANATCTYTLTVSNSADTPATASGTGTVAIKPKPILASSTISPTPTNPLSITANTPTTFTLTLPARSSASASVTAVTFTRNDGSGAVTQTKSGGGSVGTGDVNATPTNINVDAPATADGDSKTLTYTLTASNNATTPFNAVATGVVTVIPKPVLASATFNATPAGVTGGFNSTIQLALPSINITDASKVSSVSLTISGTGCGSGAVAKHSPPGGAVGFTDLGTTITIDPPSSATTDTKACTYTLDVANTASTPVHATATGTFNIYEQPGLASASFTLSPATITGGTTPGTFTTTLPNKTSTAAPATVTFERDNGDLVFVAQTKQGGGAVVAGDLNNSITVPLPTTSTSDSKTFTYRLTIANAATTPATAVANGTLTVVKPIVLTSNTFTLSPATVPAGPATSISVTLPGLAVGSGAANTVSFAIGGDAGCGTGAVAKTSGGGGAVGAGDLGTGITFDSPTTATSVNANCTYTLTVTNAAGTPATATGTLAIAGIPAFASALTVTPNALIKATVKQSFLSFPLPSLVSPSQATSVAMTVTPAGGATTAVNKNGTPAALIPANLGTTVTLDSSDSSAITASKVYTYSLTATNSLGTSTPATTTVTAYPSAANLGQVRIGATATLLPNGTVLITGGGTGIANGLCSGASNTTEIYNPATGASASAGNMNQSRCFHTATLATNGKVYVMGGVNNTTIDVYDTNSPGWTHAPNLATARTGHTATLITSGTNAGKIVVAGGYDPSGLTTKQGRSSLELFDPVAGTSTLYSGTGTHAFNVGRAEMPAVYAGKWIYYVGGKDPDSNGGACCTVNISPSIDALDTTLAVDAGSQIVHTNQPANVTIGRFAHSGAALSSSTLVIAGGIDDGGNLTASMQTYHVNNTTGAVDSVDVEQTLATARARFPLLATVGVPNKFLVFGGTITLAGGGDTGTNSIELIDATATLSASGSGTLQSVRQAAAAADLQSNLSSANSLYVIAGGSSSATGGIEVIAGP